MRLLSLFLGLLTALASAGTAADYGKTPADDVYVGAERRHEHLLFTGFYGSALGHWNFTETLAPYSNLTWIEHGSITEIVNRLAQARDNRVRAVVSLQRLVFNTDATLRDDYWFKLAELQEAIDIAGLHYQVAMLYPIDEPYLRAGNSAATDRHRVYFDLLEVNREIRKLFPGKPTGVIFNKREVVRNDFRIPYNYSWVGYDCYQNNYDCEGRPITDLYRILLDKMTDKQRLMAVPTGMVRYEDYERQKYEPREIYERRRHLMAKGLRKRLQHHYEIALSEPRFIAFIPFIWSMEAAPNASAHEGFGIDRFIELFPQGGEELVAEYERIGRQIKLGRVVYPNLTLTQTEWSRERRKNDWEGQILRVDGAGLVSAWGLNKAMPHKPLRMELVVKQDDRLIYRSGVRRSFIDDKQGVTRILPGPVVGVHGYRHRLPADITQLVRNGDARLRLRLYADGPGLKDYKDVGG